MNERHGVISGSCQLGLTLKTAPLPVADLSPQGTLKGTRVTWTLLGGTDADDFHYH